MAPHLRVGGISVHTSSPTTGGTRGSFSTPHSSIAASWAPVAMILATSLLYCLAVAGIANYIIACLMIMYSYFVLLHHNCIVSSVQGQDLGPISKYVCR